MGGKKDSSWGIRPPFYIVDDENVGKGKEKRGFFFFQRKGEKKISFTLGDDFDKIRLGGKEEKQTDSWREMFA